MRIRTLFPITIALAALALAAACGDDDTPDPQDSATAPASVTPTPSALATASILLSPSRELPPADHAALGVFDVLNFYAQELHGGAITPVPCTSFDFELGIIDCTAQGYGTIAVDPIPATPAPDDLECRALLNPEGEFFAASCSGILDSGPGAYIYSILS